MEQRVSLITLGVEDLDSSGKFYEALGWNRVESPDGVIAFDLIGQTLGLYPKAALAEELGMDKREISGFSGITLAHNLREKSDVAKLLDLASDAGGKILKPAQDVFWGGYHGYFSDPDGHVWEIAWNPFAPLARDGAFRWNGFSEN